MVEFTLSFNILVFEVFGYGVVIWYLVYSNVLCSLCGTGGIILNIIYYMNLINGKELNLLPLVGIQ